MYGEKIIEMLPKKEGKERVGVEPAGLVCFTAVAVKDCSPGEKESHGGGAFRVVVFLRYHILALGYRCGQALDYGGWGNGKHGRSTKHAAGKRRIRLGYGE